MASSFTTNKSIEQPANGDYVNTWNVPVNADWAIIDTALGGQTNINVTGASGTVNLIATQYQPLTINFSGTLTANLIYVIPNGVGGQWNVNNTTTGAFTITLASGGGGLSNVIAQGFVTQVYSDGTNIQPTNTSAAIPNNAVTNSKLAQMPTLTIKSNLTGSTANPADNTLTAILDTITTSPGALLYRGASVWAALGPGATSQVLTSQGATAPTWLANTKISVRQTVMSGPGGAAPNFFPGTSASLTLQMQNTNTVPLIATIANGFNASGNSDLLVLINSNPSVSLPANNTNFIYIDSSGNVGSTALQPIYQYGGTLSTTSGQYSFDIIGMQMYLGNGSAANAVSVVFVGEAVTGASTVTSTICYAFDGYYDSGFTNTLPGLATNVAKNSNIGVVPQQIRVITQCLNAEGNYSVGDQVLNITSQFSGSNAAALTIGATRNTVFFVTGASTAMFWLNKNTGGALTPTAANWAYRIIANRGW